MFIQKLPTAENDPARHCRHAIAAIDWLRRSIEATGRCGSAHSYSPVWGWAKAYPETTGYLIPTLLRYADLLHDDSLHALAVQCHNWLLDIQLSNGAWAGGMVGETRPSVFNTAMILRGVTPTLPGALPENGAKAGLAWLLSTLSPDGVWRRDAYVPGFIPSYYTYAVWSVLEAGAALNMPEAADKMRTALHFYATRFQPDGTVQDWGLKPGRQAFTHTIAYTLQGFLESALLLGETEILEKTVLAGEGLLAEYNRTQNSAGRFGTGWRGVYWFTSPLGNCQLSIFYRRLWEITGAEKFRRASDGFLAEALRFQNLRKSPNTHGALPGSAPFWGPYLRWRYPNWGAKFLLDALLPLLLPAHGGRL